MAVARRRGLAAVWGRVRKDNLPMIALFRRYGADRAGADESGDLDLRIDLTAPATPPPPGRGRSAKRPAGRSTGKRRPSR